MKVCRICLSNEGRLYPMTKKLNALFIQLTGLDNPDKRLPKWLCAECGLRLMSYEKLRQKSIRAHGLILQILDKTKNLTKKNMLQINSLRLSSSLNFSSIDLTEYIPNIDSQEEQFLSMNNQEEHFLTINNQEEHLTINNQEEHLTINNPEEEFLTIHVPDLPDLLVPKEEKEDFSDDKVEEEAVLDDSFELKLSTDSVKADDDNFDVEFDSISMNDGIEVDYCEIEYLDEEEIEEKQSNTPMESEEYLPSDSSNFEPSLPKKSKLKKLPKKRVKTSKKQLPVPVKAKKEDELIKYFEIIQLSLEEQIDEIQKRKESADYALATYKCEFCYKRFSSNESYDDHMFKHSLESGNFECQVCHVRLKSEYAVNHHIRRTHAQLFKCKSCDFVTSTRGSADRHGKLHTGALYLCPYCVRQFNDVTVYWRHMRLRHNTSSDVCVACGFSFISAKGLLVHKTRKHAGFDFEKPMEGPRCEKCKVTFASEEAYNTHIRVSAKHKEERGTKDKRPTKYLRKHKKPNPCEECGVQLSSLQVYMNHFRRFHPDSTCAQSYTKKSGFCMCEVCGKLLQDSAALEKHMLFTHANERTRRFICKDCPKSFSRAIYLIKHCKNAHNKDVEVSKPSKNPCKCQQCGKVLTSKEGLRVHLKTHDATRQKPYACEYCGRSFYVNCRLQRHMAIHLKKGKYKCSICYKEFFVIAELERHMASSHNTKKYINIAKIKLNQ